VSQTLSTQSGARIGMLRAVTVVVSGAPTLAAASWTAGITGATSYGLITLIGSVPTILNFVVIAAGAPIVNATASGSETAVATAIRRSIRSSLVAACCVTAVAALLGLIVPWTEILGVRADNTQVSTAVLIATVMWATWLVLSISSRVLIAMGRMDLAILGLAITGPATLAITALLRITHSSDLLYVFPPLLGNLAGALATWALVTLRLRVPLGRLTRTAFSRSSTGDFDGRQTLTLALLVTEGALAAGNFFDRIIVAHRLGAADTATYSLFAQFTMAGLSVAIAISQSRWPNYARARAEKRAHVGTAKELLSLGAVGVLLAALSMAGLAVANRWVGHDKVSVPLTSFIGWSVFIVLRSMFQPLRYMLSVEGRAWRLAFLAVAALIVNLPLSWILANDTLGASGPVFASIACFVPMIALAVGAARDDGAD
jgi:O-antigen/teichoic acid export membrane protein